MKKIVLMLALMVMGSLIFASSPYVKNSVAEYETAINNAKIPNNKVFFAMALACFQDKALTTNFEAFKSKFAELSKKYGYKFKNEQDYNFAQFILKSQYKELYQPMIKYADGKNIYVNLYWVNNNVLKLNKEEFLNIFQTCMNDRKILNNIGYCTVLVNNIKKYQNLLTPEETVKCLKELKRQIYPNISKSDKWKELVVRVELMIKANE